MTDAISDLPFELGNRESYFQWIYSKQKSKMDEKIFRKIVYITHAKMVHPSQLTQDMIDSVSDAELQTYFYT